MKLLIVSATPFEIKPTLNFLNHHAKELNPLEFTINHHTVSILISGPGQIQTSFAIGQYFAKNNIDVAINAGICGAFDHNVKKGVVYQVVKDRMADFGAEESNGIFTDIFEMGLLEKNSYPYSDGWLQPLKPSLEFLNLPEVSGITVNKVSGTQESINSLRKKYNPDIETMEGAGFFYACNMLNVPSLQIRSVSNHVEPRNKNNWNIPLAINTLNNILVKTLNNL
jgi:futalosine hydrolase